MHVFSHFNSIHFISSQWHLCGFTEYQNIAISAGTAKLCLAWPKFLGIKREAQATTNTLHHSSHPEQSRCLSNLGTCTMSMLWDRTHNLHTSPCSCFSVRVQRNEWYSCMLLISAAKEVISKESQSWKAHVCTDSCTSSIFGTQTAGWTRQR